MTEISAGGGFGCTLVSSHLHIYAVIHKDRRKSVDCAGRLLALKFKKGLKDRETRQKSNDYSASK